MYQKKHGLGGGKKKIHGLGCYVFKNQIEIFMNRLRPLPPRAQSTNILILWSISLQPTILGPLEN